VLEKFAKEVIKKYGIVGTPDGKYLYVAEAKANRILKS
jgi:hypothetical protein